MDNDPVNITRFGPGRVMVIPLLEDLGLTAMISTRDFKTIDTFLSAIGIVPEHAVMAEQVHGNNIVAVGKKDRGSGICKPPIKACDALITDIPAIPLVIRTADCVPVFIAEKGKKAVGLVHAGWKGTVGNIAGRALKEMADRFDISPSNCIITVGPCIGRDCYEVDDRVIAALKNDVDGYEDHIRRTDDHHWNLDLVKLNVQQLIGSGVKKGNIHMTGSCTHCDTDTFYSYRKEGSSAGRNFSVLMIKDQ